MINITYIVPYPGLKELVYRTFNTHPHKAIINYNISVVTADKLEGINYDCDVFVTRGYTAKKLRKLMPHMPQIEITITAYDIIKSIRECQEKFNPKKIGFVWTNASVNSVTNLKDLFKCKIEVYTPKNFKDIQTTVNQAIQDGCDALIGGYSVNMCAENMDINSTIIKTGQEAILQSLNEAIRTVEVMRQERAKSQIFQTIAQCSQDGIIYVTCNGRIDVFNQNTLSIFSKRKEDLHHKYLEETFPFMFENFKEVLKKGTEKNNELHKIDTMVLSVNYIPVKIQSKIAGVVINLQDVTKIQQIETQIRRKMNKKGLYAKYNFTDIIHKNRKMKWTIETAKKFAQVSSNILIVGETGTGKELMVQSIHNASKKNAGPFVAVNCAALPESLLESELFGYVAGAFTGANKNGKTGLFELAHNGTLFLDEVSELPITFQSKLLRALQEKEIRKVGDNKVIPIDVRIIAACNKNLNKLVEQGKFRQDLLYRLDVLKIYIPPLRKRKEDIYELFMHYVKIYNKKTNRPPQKLAPDAKELLLSYDFKGNIRELINIVERITVLNTTETLDETSMEYALFPQDIDETIPVTEISQTIKNIENTSEKELIKQALNNANHNKTQAAKALGINRSTLWRKLKKYQINI